MKYQLLLALLASKGLATVFEATDEWQEVPEGYEIPGGLHVRMDFMTGKKHAKLPDPSDDNDGDASVEGVHVQDVVFQHQEDQDDIQLDQGLEKAHQKPTKDAVLKIDDLLLKEALEEITVGHSTSKLEEVEDWAHDVEYGETIASCEPFLQALISLINDPSQPGATRELASRVFGATFQNNPAALDQLFPGHDGVIGDLLQLIQQEETSTERLQLRLIYALGSLVTDPRGLQKYVSHSGDQVLQQVFQTTASNQVRSKCAVLIEKLVESTDREAANLQWSGVIQEVLAHSDGGGGVAPVLEALVRIHEHHQKKLPVQKPFLKWLSARATGSSDSELSDLARSVQHLVFGNPNAHRKDEL